MKNKFKYIKLLLPAVLVLMLVVDAISIYEFPDLSKYGAPVYGQARAKAQKPNLKIKDQKKKEEKKPEGTGGKLGTFKEIGNLRDGTYTGSAKGYGGAITVNVTVKGGKISAVKVVSAPGEDEPYISRAKKLTSTIVKKNSTNVDAVSGATYSSNGIIKAVRNALKKAAGQNPGAAEKKTSKENPKKKLPEIPRAITAGDWKDGSYQGTGEGFGGNLKVTVVIKDGKITAINIGKHSEDEEYYSKARGKIIPSIIKKQGTDVDTVSGATYSSIGIIQAVTDALRKAQANKPDNQPDNQSGDQPVEQRTPSDDGSNPSTEQEDSKEITRIAKVYCDDDEDFEDYDLTMTFVVRDGKVLDIKDVKQVIDAKINDSYIKAAVRGIKRQLEGKPTLAGVDTVSGATCTSNTIIYEGIEALKSAK